MYAHCECVLWVVWGLEDVPDAFYRNKYTTRVHTKVYSLVRVELQCVYTKHNFMYVDCTQRAGQKSVCAPVVSRAVGTRTGDATCKKRGQNSRILPTPLPPPPSPHTIHKTLLYYQKLYKTLYIIRVKMAGVREQHSCCRQVETLLEIDAVRQLQVEERKVQGTRWGLFQRDIPIYTCKIPSGSRFRAGARSEHFS